MHLGDSFIFQFHGQTLLGVLASVSQLGCTFDVSAQPYWHLGRTKRTEVLLDQRDVAGINFELEARPEVAPSDIIAHHCPGTFIDGAVELTTTKRAELVYGLKARMHLCNSLR
jgi:hypothetical protein